MKRFLYVLLIVSLLLPVMTASVHAKDPKVKICHLPDHEVMLYNNEELHDFVMPPQSGFPHYYKLVLWCERSNGGKVITVARQACINGHKATDYYFENLYDGTGRYATCNGVEVKPLPPD